MTSAWFMCVKVCVGMNNHITLTVILRCMYFYSRYPASCYHDSSIRQLQLQRATPAIQHSSHNSADNLPHRCVMCNDFYMKHILLSDAAMVALEMSTINQGNHLWHVSRQLRITASNVHRIPKRATTSVVKALQCITNPNFYGNAATQHGLNHEAVARLQFQKDFGLVVEQRGIFVCKKKPWLSATPDGIIESHCAILEIKCPFAQDCKEVIRREKYDVVRREEPTC